jgi:hypothetical protein
LKYIEMKGMVVPPFDEIIPRNVLSIENAEEGL